MRKRGEGERKFHNRLVRTLTIFLAQSFPSSLSLPSSTHYILDIMPGRRALHGTGIGRDVVAWMIQRSIVETTASQTILSARPSTSSRLWRAASTITRFVFVRRVACKAKAEVSKKRGLWQSILRKKVVVRSRQKATVVRLR